MSEIIKVVIRDSKLSEKQAFEAIRLFKSKLNFQFEIVKIKSFGDKNKKISLLNNKIDDIWTRELDEALLKNEADIAIHSAKDLPIKIKKGIALFALLPPLDNSDSLVSRNGYTLKTLPKRAKVGTSSLLRKNELLNYRKDLKVVSIRGTIEERIALVDKGVIDALIVATCALKRLGMENRISQILPFKTHPLQGSLAVVAKDDFKYKEEIKQFDIRNKYGKVYLIGAGCSNKDLVTLKAFRAIEKSDIIFYDDLLDKNFLTNFNVKKIYVGKRKNYKSFSQDEINEMMYKEVTNGKTVARLKSGYPFIFGRGYEELSFFQERFINVEVIPGITSGITASGFSSIPLTARGISSSIGFFTGHKERGKILNNFKTDTFVFYMAADNFKEIAKKLKKAGVKKNTSVAIIKNAGFYNQREYIYRIDEILRNNIEIDSPSIIIVGDVVDLYNNKYSYSYKKKLLYTGTAPELYECLFSESEIYHYPLIKIEGIKNSNEIEKMISIFDKYNFIIFTSKFAVISFFNILYNYNLDIRSLNNKKIAAIGQRTKDELKKYCISPDIVSVKENSRGLLETLKNINIKKLNILYPSSNLSDDFLKNELEKEGNKVDKIKVYTNNFNNEVAPVNLDFFDGIIFTSPSSIYYFKRIHEKIPENIIIYLKDGSTLTTFKKEFANEKIKII